MSYPSERSLAPGLRWLEGTSPVLETWPCLQSEPGGADPCSFAARRGPPWPRAPEASASPGSPPGSCSSPLPAPRPPTGAPIHSAPTFSPSPASPVPLTPLDAVLSAMPDPGLSGEGIRCHQVHPLPASAWVAVPRGNGRPQAGPPTASLLQKSLWSPYLRPPAPSG